MKYSTLIPSQFHVEFKLVTFVIFLYWQARMQAYYYKITDMTIVHLITHQIYKLWLTSSICMERKRTESNIKYVSEV